MPKLIPRPDYSAVFQMHLDTPSVKVLTGVRRCGKSSLLALLAHELLDSGVPARNVMHRRLDEFSIPLVLTADDLAIEVATFLDGVDPEQPSYVFLDEVQQVEGWERVVRGLETKEGVDVWITGSNASMLSGDLATLIAGRYTHVPIYPLSFAEYFSFARESGEKALEVGVDELFTRYRRFGGMPGLFGLKDIGMASARSYLTSILESVILNDVASRQHVRDIDALEKVVRYAFSTSGTLCSTRNIAQALKGAGRSITQDTVDAYLHGLVEALIIQDVPQQGMQGKEVLRPLHKFYPVDVGLRNLSIGFEPRDLGFQLEDIVCMELLRRGCSVSVGASRKGEVDFVALTPEGLRVYVQVTEDLANPDTYERELAPLRALNDAFPKLVIAATGLREGTTGDGIRVISIIPWLLEGTGSVRTLR